MEQVIENMCCMKSIKDMKLSKVDFIRGLGIVESRFVISFASETDKIDIEIETNFRIRNDKVVLLSYNDLYLDLKRNEMSIRKFRSQLNIEKSYLYSQIEVINKKLTGAKIIKMDFKKYGDIYISFDKEIVMEILNDTHLENATLYRIISTSNNLKDTYECQIENNTLVFKKIEV